MKNPFQDFGGYEPKIRELPLDKMVKDKREVMSKLLKGYARLLTAGKKDFVWLVQNETVERAYRAAEAAINGTKYDMGDIEEFCYSIETVDDLPYKVTGPLGIYISALINYAKEDSITLNLVDLKMDISLIGFRLPKGKTLTINGDVGDFTGMGVDGGTMTVNGNAKNWTGAGMKRGTIEIKEKAGYHTGEWMTGGEISVGTRVRGLGDSMYGRVYENGKLIFPVS